MDLICSMSLWRSCTGLHASAEMLGMLLLSPPYKTELAKTSFKWDGDFLHKSTINQKVHNIQNLVNSIDGSARFNEVLQEACICWWKMQQCWLSSHDHMRGTHAMYLQADLTHIFQSCRSSKGSGGARLQNDCRAAALLQETPLVPPHLLSSGHFMRLLSARRCNPWPPVCSHPFPLLSLAPCWDPGSLQAWGVSLLQHATRSCSRSSDAVMST